MPVTANGVIDAYRELAADPLLAPFLGGTYRPSRFVFTQVALVELLALAVVAAVLLVPPSSSISANFGAVAATTIIIGTVGLATAARRPFRPETQWLAIVRSVSASLVLCAAWLNAFNGVNPLQLAADGTTAEARPLSVTALSFVCFALSLVLFAALVVSFVWSLLQGAAVEERVIQAVRAAEVTRRTRDMRKPRASAAPAKTSDASDAGGAGSAVVPQSPGAPAGAGDLDEAAASAARRAGAAFAFAPSGVGGFGQSSGRTGAGRNRNAFDSSPVADGEADRGFQAQGRRSTLGTRMRLQADSDSSDDDAEVPAQTAARTRSRRTSQTQRAAFAQSATSLRARSMSRQSTSLHAAAGAARRSAAAAAPLAFSVDESETPVTTQRLEAASRAAIAAAAKVAVDD